jgi:E3 ubiquitin-protein ligase DOA10
MVLLSHTVIVSKPINYQLLRLSIHFVNYYEIYKAGGYKLQEGVIYMLKSRAKISTIGFTKLL